MCKTKRLQFTRLVAFIATFALVGISTLAVPNGANANPAVSLSNPSVAPDPTCASPVTGSVDVSVVYDSPSGPTVTTSACFTSTECGTNAACRHIDTTETTISNQMIEVTGNSSAGASLLASASDPNSGTYSGTVAVDPEGTKTMTFNATASNTVTVTTTSRIRRKWTSGSQTAADLACSLQVPGFTDTVVTPPGPAVTTPSTMAAPAVTNFVADLEGPTFGMATGKDTSSVMQGGTVNVNSQLVGGSACTNFDLTASMDSISDMTSSSFGAPTGFTCPAIGSGIAPDKMNALALVTSCATPPDDYDGSLSASTVDLCGGDNSPDAFDLGMITVTSNPACSFQCTQILTAPVATDYEHLDCFTAVKPANRIRGLKANQVNTNPGTVHTGTIFTFDPAGDNPEDITVKFTIPTAFEFLQTGGSPAAHVFTGPIPAGGIAAIDLHSPIHPNPEGWSEITDTATITGPYGAVLNVMIPGPIPAANAVYVRAHVKYKGTEDVPDDDEAFNFMTEVSVDSPSAMTSCNGDIIGMPTCGGPYEALCVDGLFNDSTC